MNSRFDDTWPAGLNGRTLRLVLLVFVVSALLIQIPDIVQFGQCLDGPSKSCSTGLSQWQLLCLFATPVVTLAVLAVARRLRWADIGLSKPCASPRALAGLLVGGVVLIVALNAALEAASHYLPVLGQQQFSPGADPTPGGLAIFVLLAVGVAPLTEELAFRGFEFTIVARRWGPLAGSLISSVSFALAHGQIGAGVVTFVFGMYLCLLFTKTRSLFPGIVLHIVNNSLAVAAFILAMR